MADALVRPPGETIELVLELRDQNTPANDPVAGQTCWVAIRRTSDNYFYDFTNTAWKSTNFAAIVAGDTDCQQSLTDRGDGTYIATAWDQDSEDGGVARTYVVTYVVPSGDYQGMSSELWVFSHDFLKATIADVEDIVGKGSVAAAFAMLAHKTALGGGTLTAYKADETTVWIRLTASTDANALPIVGLDPV